MRHLRQRNVKIISEIMNYLLKIGCTEIHVDYYTYDDYIHFIFKCIVENLDGKLINDIKTLINMPRRHDIEEYYWELTGDDDLDTELSLVGMMIDTADISYEDNKHLKIDLKRIN